jgi:hypothetical protein
VRTLPRGPARVSHITDLPRAATSPSCAIQLSGEIRQGPECRVRCGYAAETHVRNTLLRQFVHGGHWELTVRVRGAWRRTEAEVWPEHRGPLLTANKEAALRLQHQRRVSRLHIVECLRRQADRCADDDRTSEVGCPADRRSGVLDTRALHATGRRVGYPESLAVQQGVRALLWKRANERYRPASNRGNCLGPTRAVAHPFSRGFRVRRQPSETQ